MSNNVTLTFTGNTKDLEGAFDRVGGAGQSMGRQVADSADGFDRAGRAADELDTKAMGFRDTMTGVQDTALGTSQIMRGDLFTGFLTLGMGVGDLGSAFYNLIIPTVKSTASLIAQKAAMAGHAVASAAVRAATLAWTGAQWLLNVALSANPIGLIIIAIAALIAIIVVIATKTDWFQRGWRAAWGGMTRAAQATWRWISGTLWPGMRRVADGVAGAFRAAFSAIARAWNATVGRLHWTVPSWVPGLGGASVGAPRLPTFHTGGKVPGAPGQEMLALLQAGETITPAGRPDNIIITLRSDGSRMADALMELLDQIIRGRGLALAASRG